MIKTEQLIKDLHNQFYNQSQSLIDLTVAKELKAIKEKHNYSKIHMISGMGTWVFKTYKNYKECTHDHNKEEDFKALDEFLMLMAGEYNVYPSDCII